MSDPKERSWWHDIAAPVAVAVTVSAIGGTLSLIATQSILGERMRNTEVRVDKLEALVSEQGNLLREIREDVSFVRGQLERGK